MANLLVTSGSSMCQLIANMSRLNSRKFLSDGRIPLLVWIEEISEIAKAKSLKIEVASILHELGSPTPRPSSTLVGLFPHERILEMRDALVKCGSSDIQTQEAMLSGLPDELIRILPTEAERPDERLLLTMQALNVTTLLSDGEHPFEEWLATAHWLLGPRPEAPILERALDELRNQAIHEKDEKGQA